MTKATMLNPIATALGSVTTIEDSVVVIGVEMEAQLEKNGEIGAKNAKNNSATMDMLFANNVPSWALASPYTKAKGQTLKKEAEDAEDIKLATGTFTWPQVYDAVRLPIAKGWCTAAQWQLYTMAAGETTTDSREATRSEITTGIENRQKSVRRGVETREIKAKAKADMEAAQTLEDERVAGTEEVAKDMKLSDFMPKKGANDTKPPRDAAGDCVMTAIRKLNKMETPPDDCDSIGAIAALRTALVCLNVKDETLDPHSDANQ